MSNVKRAKNPGVVLQLDKPRKFILDWNAFAAIEDETGKPYQEFISELETRSTAKSERLLLWAGLQSDAEDNGETLTLRDAGALRTKIDGATLGIAFAEALKNAVVEFARLAEESGAEEKNEK